MDADKKSSGISCTHARLSIFSCLNLRFKVQFVQARHTSAAMLPQPIACRFISKQTENYRSTINYHDLNRQLSHLDSDGFNLIPFIMMSIFWLQASDVCLRLERWTLRMTTKHFACVHTWYQMRYGHRPVGPICQDAVKRWDRKKL